MKELDKPYGVRLHGLVLVLWFQNLDSARKFSIGFKHARRNKDFVHAIFNDPFTQRGYDFYWKLWWFLRTSHNDEKMSKARPFIVTRTPKNDERMLEM